MDEFIKTLIAEVKSQGVFDEFRFNCCLADVDTKPAYQNVRTRVETAVNDFLAKQHWTPDTNKVQLRERLRKHLLDSEVLNKGVDQIVDQVVNPKVATIFEPKIESIVYKYLGITPPPPPPRPPGPLLPAPPLPPFAGHMNGSRLLRVETGADGLMPTDLEQISPDSDQATVKSDLKDESKDDDLPPGVDDERNFDEDTSPSYEPLSDDKPGSSKDLNNGLLNHSDSVNGVSQASQLSQVSSDSRLTMASSTESVAEIQRAAPASNSVELIANMPANISEEAQMPKFSENSSDASVAVGVDNCSRQLHFDIKQDAITFEGTERRSSVSGTNGGPLELSIEDAIMSEVKANIDDANNASIEPKHVPQPPLPPLPKVEPEPVQPPAPPDVEPEPVQPPPPPPPEIMEEPVQPPEPTEVKLEPVQPSPPPEIKPEPAQPSTPPELKSESEPCQKVEPPATSPATESGIGSLSEPVVEDASLKDCKSPLKQELQEPHTEADKVKEEKTKVFALPEEAEALKGATASPSLTSSQSKSSSRDKDKDKERRHHSHSDEKQRRRSRDRDRDRDRDRSRDKSHSKHSSSSSSKHSSSRSSSSQHRSSSSKNDRSSTSSSSKSHRESSSSKRTSSTSSSRHESSSSSSHKKHKSSSSSSRSDRDKDKDKERESHSRSHHSNSSSSSSSKRKDQDRGRDRDRHKSNSATTAPIQDDHTESKTKLNKRRSSDSNDEGKPPGSGCPPKSSRIEGAPEKAVESAVENGNGTNGNSNGGSGSNGACDSVNGVVIVSDILQQSSSSFIELTAGSQSQKEEDDKKDEVAEKSLDQRAEEPAAQENRLSGEPQKDDKVECVPNFPDEESKRVDGLEAQLVEPEGISEDPAGPSDGSLPENMQKEAVKPEHMPAPPIPNSSADELAEDPVTHFEENADEFTDRLQLINRLIEDNQNLVNQLGEDHDQVEVAHIRETRRRSGVKRRCSSLQEQPQVGRESTPPPLFATLGSSTSGSPTKRLRQEEPKSSPTPSEASVNSKENEALEKQERDALNARRFSQKLCQQQRYTNDDLYKPRPILSQRSRRRGLDSIL
ncbi:biorientation of chromosomes in cell division protein 1-like 1 isoform X1 [Drosophila kikkawai]|uniref:Biorientation of chromosomes in cell division protein 1-like 1 isoform X1 n=1 Tax=Drosophila kikkawai TaxID=30033 RepID=A0A6P4JJL9_DROKI|nr:biorientation of chromosomes in cell division protein 1-like 1 isoform X1 [Drosophila kikkawai]